jgi:hypothetical protein
MRSILVLADRSAESEPRLQAALSLARAQSGHLTVLIDTPIARYLATDGLGGGYLAADIMRESVDADDAFAEALHQRLVHEDVPYDILRAEDEPTDAIAEAGRLNDVVVLSRELPFVGEAVLSGTAPVLVVAGMRRPSMCRSGSPAWPGMAGMRRRRPCGRLCRCWFRRARCMC